MCTNECFSLRADMSCLNYLILNKRFYFGLFLSQFRTVSHNTRTAFIFQRTPLREDMSTLTKIRLGNVLMYL
jgi:hypothetical protein